MNPVTTIATALSLDADIFYNTLYNKSRNRDTKKCFHPTSDHVAIAWIYAQWANILNKGVQSAGQFCRDYQLHPERMMVLHSEFCSSCRAEIMIIYYSRLAFISQIT